MTDEVKAEPVVDRAALISPPPTVTKKQCGEFHKLQNAVCVLEKDHEGKHEAQWPSSGPTPTRFSWPKS